MKMNKKGFTLAELLIVIAIIAILIAIAIPAFSAQLDNARLQADHANVRSAYAIVQTANLTGDDMDGVASTVDIADNYVYCSDGTFKSTTDAGTTAVKLVYTKTLVAGAATNPASCQSAAKCIGHKKDANIVVTGSTGNWKLKDITS